MIKKTEVSLDGMEMEEDVEYGNVNGRSLKLDLFRPKNRRGLLPGLMVYHGGGFRAGDKIDPRPHVGILGPRGFVCASVNYRLSGEARFPAAIEDSKCAVRWMRANAQRLGVRTDRIAAIGYSAGGTIAAFLGTTNGMAEFEGTGGHQAQSSAVQAAVSVFGVTDILELALRDRAKPENVAVEYVGGDPRTNPEPYLRASPLTYASGASAPHMFLHGTEDPLVPLSHSIDMREALQAAGVPAEVYIWNGIGHGYPWESDLDEISYDKTEDFLKRQLR